MSALLLPLVCDASAAAAAGPATTSTYETSASTTSLYAQGEAAGYAGQQGIVILDFGRPASDGTSDGTLDYSHTFISFAQITAGVQSYLMGYFDAAPVDTRLDVAIGTNNSCGVGQPCGSIRCGCPDEPGSYVTWGQELAYTVQDIGTWSAGIASSHGFTDTVHVVAGDDAEPAFDPGYYNTYDVMQGYAQAVSGSYPPMVDYGSADPGFWSNAELLQIANGFSPNVAMPEIYEQPQVAEWSALLSYAKNSLGESVTLYGVMTSPAGTETPASALSDLLGGIAPITGQGSIGWLSSISH